MPLQTVSTALGARTLTVDPASGTVYLPTADLKPTGATSGSHRFAQVPDTFRILVVTRTAGKIL
jgi:hypothetical protein